MAKWSLGDIEAVLMREGWLARQRPIAHGCQFVLTDGTFVNWYQTGTVLVQGKNSDLKLRAQAAFLKDGPVPAKRIGSTATPVSMARDNGVRIWTDGACLGNPGPGGYGAIIDYKGQRTELSHGYRLTTNNRMELLGAIRGLESLGNPVEVTLASDSLYLVKAMQQGWPQRWRAQGWRRTKDEIALNSDLWEQILALHATHKVTFNWIRGHTGHPENERCDQLAVAAANGLDLDVDTGYEHSLGPSFSQPA